MVNTRMKRYGSQTNTKNCTPNTPEKCKNDNCEFENETRKHVTPLQALSDATSVVDAASVTLVTSVVAAQEQLFPTKTRSLSVAEWTNKKLMTPVITQKSTDENMEPETESGKKLDKVENMHVGLEQDNEKEKEINLADIETSEEIQEVDVEINATVTRQLNPDMSSIKDKTDNDNVDNIQSASVTPLSDTEVITLDEDDGIEIIDSDEAFTVNSSFRNETKSGAQDDISTETGKGIRRVSDGHHQSQIQETEDEKRSQIEPGDISSESSDDVVIINSTNVSTEKKADEESSGKVVEFGNIHSPGSKIDASKTRISVNIEAQEGKLFNSTAHGVIKQSVTMSVCQKGQQLNKKPLILAGAEIVRNIPRGITKSGRVWKSASTKFSKNIKSKGLKQSFEKKQKLFAELKRVKEYSRARKAEIQKEKERNRERIAKVRKMREENARKAEVVQVITNTAKLKRMTKKQLKKIEKRDTTTVCRI